jgi:hypothetical protein
MKILIACEESQAVCIEMRKRGHDAFSCDILPCSGGHPEWHIQGDVLGGLDGRDFVTQNGTRVSVGAWDMMIAFPPCTHLAVSGARHFEQKRKDGRQQEGIDFFLKIVNAPIPLKATENPVGIMSTIYREPDQIIQPYYFGDEAQKTTCLWLGGLSLLIHQAEDDLFNKSTHVDRGDFYISPNGAKMPSWCSDPVGENGKKLGYNTDEIKTLRSKTFPGIAKAMAEQWG